MSTTRVKNSLIAQAQRTRNDAPAAPATAQSASRKRKREEDKPNAVIGSRFNIRPCSSSPHDTSYTLTSVDIIDRAHLPLSFLDLTPGPLSLASIRCFSARIDLLEQSIQQDGEAPGHKVLIARLEPDGTLYAIERVRHGIYALCKLGHWVKEARLRTASANSSNPSYLKRQTEISEPNSQDWWQSASLSSVSEVTYNARPSKLPRLSMQRPAILPVSVNAARKDDTNTKQPALRDPAPEIIAPQMPPQTPEQVLETVAGQYLDALYLSKTSLAFFVKGPLSRARAAFTSTQDIAFKLNELVDFLRSMLLTLASLDKKYREKLPELVRSLPPDDSSDEEPALASQAKFPPKKSKQKSKKPNKYGVYPGEDDYVKKWWLRHPRDYQGGPFSETADQTLKRRVGELRVRETFAQVVLVLEILALEASQAFKDLKNEATPNSQPQEVVPQENGRKRKNKKPQDIHTLLDLLLDKLCIWQSVEQDDMDAGPSKSEKSSKQADCNRTSKDGGSDKLRTFCIEVVIPFYMSRLPDKVAAINKRLGGPIASSPNKRRGADSSNKTREPGEPEWRTAPERQPRRSLQRVTTDTSSLTRNRHPSLARSATDSGTLPHLKRESSEADLSAIPLKPAQPVSSRNSLSDFQRFSKHQVDLNAMSAATEAKLKKKRAIEEEIKEAISTLKKPNRPQALKEFADLTDSRVQNRPQLTRKGSSAARKTQQTVQITATPKRVRKTKNAVMDSPTDHRLRSGFDEDLVPPSSDPVIPSSAIRPSGFAIPGTVLKSRGAPNTSMRSRAHAAVEETPTRGSAKMVSFFPGIGENRSTVVPQDNGLSSSMRPPVFKLPPAPVSHASMEQRVTTVPSTPTKVKQAAVLETPLKGDKEVQQSSIAVTPAKDEQQSAIAATPAKDDTKNDAPGQAGGSIYAALGWDDDDLDELA